MKLEKDDKLGQGRGAFNPATRVQIPVGANKNHYVSRHLKLTKTEITC